MTVAQILEQFIKHPSHLPKNIIWRFPRKPSTEKHIFVLGAPRSGTTLAKLILIAHPYLVGPGFETAFFTYQDIFSFQFAGISHSHIDELRQKSHDIIEFYDLFVHHIITTNQGAKYYVEKTPQHVLQLGFLTKFFPQSKFIHLIRDGRDAYCSAQYNLDVIQGSNIKRYARYWRKCINARLKVGKKDNVLDVKYEALASEPETTIKTIMLFIEENYDPKQLEPAIYSNNSLLKSKKKEFSQLSAPINSSSVKRYKKELSSEEIKQFNKIASQQLTHFGYEI